MNQTQPIAAPAHDRAGDWILTYTGTQFWPLDPRMNEVHIEDISHALSMICRFTGHTRDFYSVAQHSVLVARALPRKLQLWGLLHDASEAYLCDIARPVKRCINGYAEIEARLMGVVADRFGLEGAIPHEVHVADNALLATEIAQLMPVAPVEMYMNVAPISGLQIDPWPPRIAKRQFMQEFERLTQGDFA